MAQASRRRVLFLLSSTFGVWTTASPRSAYARGIAGGCVGAARAGLGYLLRATFGNPDSACAVGRRYLEAHARAEAEALELADYLLAAHPMSPADLRSLLARRRDEDARRRAFVLVDGWILPKAEAQVCALTVLL